MNRTPFSDEELRVLRRLYPMNPSAWIAGQLGRTICSIQGLATQLGLKKDPDYKAQTFRNCGLQIQDSGKSHRFQKGSVPANKGLRRPGWSAGRMRDTQFRKGQVNGQAALNLMPIGATRVSDGYLLVKVADLRNVAYTVNWKAVHILEWERENGRPVPPGHVVTFRDRDRMNVSLDNLELITRAENMRRNSLYNLPAELVQVIKLRAVIVRKINRRQKREEHH